MAQNCVTFITPSCDFLPLWIAFPFRFQRPLQAHSHSFTDETPNTPALPSSSGATPAEMPTTPAPPESPAPTPAAEYFAPAQTATPWPLRQPASTAPAPDSASAEPRTATPPA